MTDAMRILMVEDSADDAKLVVKGLQRTGRLVTFERVETAEAMRTALEREAWDVIISDWSMPKFSAPAALRILKEKRLDLPFIIVSGTIGEDTAVDAMRAGAHDFVLKDKLGRLAPAVEREIREWEVRVARRQADEDLLESREGLRNALRARDEFLAIASHELKTPLTSLSLEIESARRLLGHDAQAVPVEELKAKLIRVSFQVTRITALVNSFLDVTQITSGRMVLLPERLDLRKHVDGVLTGARELLIRSGSILDMRAGGPVVGKWDPTKLRSVIASLVSNAIKYGEGKRIEIDIDTQADGARFVVVDHGLGIAVEEQERIFRCFERAVPQQHFGGFGLGLWVAREIVEAHGGTITVASKLGSGSTFTVLLPLCARGAVGMIATSRPSQQPPSPPLTIPTVPLSSAATSASVMVIDDDGDIREIMSEILTRAGYSVVTAGNGVEALESLKSVKPSLILLDLNMPVMDGFEFRRMQRRDPAVAHVPTVVISALHQMRERIADLAVDDALEKPVDLERLLRVVRQYCGSPS